MRARAGRRRRQISAGTSSVASLVSPVAARPSNLVSLSIPDSRLSRKRRPSPRAASCISPALAVDERFVAGLELGETLDALADARLERRAHRQAHAAHAHERPLGMARGDHARVRLGAEEDEAGGFRRAQLEHARESRRRPQQGDAVGGRLGAAGLDVVLDRPQQGGDVIGWGCAARVRQVLGRTAEERYEGRR